MKNDYSHSLQDVINQLIKAYRWSGKIDEQKIIDSWKAVVGNMIDSHTTKLQVKEKTLFVSLDSSALRSELMMARSKIVDSLNKEAGSKIVNDIVFR